MSPFITLLLLAQLGIAPTSPPVSPASLEGTVLRSGSRDPVEDVTVVLFTLNDDAFVNFANEPRPLSISTDAQGRFSFKNLRPDTYRLGFVASGYVRQEYGQRTFPGRGSVIQLTAGQDLKDLVVEMTPTGTVSGTVRDADRRPLTGVPVQLMRLRYDAEGERALRPTADIASTDDRGQYRLYFVTPGQYYLSAGTFEGGQINSTGPGGNEVPEMFPRTDYPGVVEVRFGGEISGADFTLARTQGIRVSGRIIDSTTGVPPEKPKIHLRYRLARLGWDYSIDKVIYENGVFEFRDVLPGLFAVTASIDEPGPQYSPEERRRLQRRGHSTFEVGGSDVKDILVTVSPGISIPGRVKVEGTEFAKSAYVPGPEPEVGLLRTMNGSKPSIPGLPAPTNGPLNPDGTFTIHNVQPGEFRLWAGALQPMFYVKQARLGSTDILKAPFHFTGREVGSFDIVLSSKVASVEGTVTSNRLPGVQGAQVVLVPDESRHIRELFKIARTDQYGRFNISNVPPGDYKLYAWEAIEPFAWFDLELAKRWEQFATPVHLMESDKKSVGARLIPAGSQ